MTKWNVLSKFRHHDSAWFLLASVFVVMGEFGWSVTSRIGLAGIISIWWIWIVEWGLWRQDFNWNPCHLRTSHGGQLHGWRRWRRRCSGTYLGWNCRRSECQPDSQKWRNHSDADLTHLQGMRINKLTSQQTQWAGKIFQRESTTS